MSPPTALTPRSAFSGLRLENDGVLVDERDGMGLVTVQVRQGKIVALRKAMAGNFGLELPMGATRATAGGIAFAGTAPGTWLASKEGAGNAFAASLSESIGEFAALADQSDGLGVLRLTGARVRDLLSRLVPIDVHARALPVGGVASTVSGLIAVTVWRLEDRAEGVPVFEMAIPRSFAASFARMLTEIVAGLPAGGSFPGSAITQRL